MKMRFAAPVLACAFLAVAVGAGTKIRSMSPVGSGLTENPNCDGMAMLKFDDRNQETTIHVVLHGFLPNTTYGIKLDSDGGGFSDPLAVTTNNGGNGNYNLTVPQNRTSNPIVVVYIWDGDPDSIAIDEVTDAEKRAVGSVQ